MNVITLLKRGFLAALVLSVVVGCASAPKQEEPAAAQTTAAEAQTAINEAKAAIAAAESEGALWRDTGSILKEAEAALQAGDYAKAIDLANKARQQARTALDQKRAEQAAQTSQAASGSYTVMRGDSLWRIAGKSEVYGNPYQWPLIYKANRDKIKDADLIYPGQVFAVRHDWSSADVNAAVQHARTRGAWSLGAVEDSDRAYLAR